MFLMNKIIPCVPLIDPLDSKPLLAWLDTVKKYFEDVKAVNWNEDFTGYNFWCLLMGSFSPGSQMLRYAQAYSDNIRDVYVHKHKR